MFPNDRKKSSDGEIYRHTSHTGCSQTLCKSTIPNLDENRLEELHNLPLPYAYDFELKRKLM